ncbi:galactosylgalactosylxylosylprotein 3-beta-glucuronosyltransferase 1 isoform X4 [Macaca fascicularis]|uniref:galactosylgalactosylxylosylprotein 3-beta-glucuronosyltransferase 1 isoform X4 n=1 Tax=Macaca fascicularis TaxID=9541 RepID=UPI003D155299
MGPPYAASRGPPRPPHSSTPYPGTAPSAPNSHLPSGVPEANEGAACPTAPQLGLSVPESRPPTLLQQPGRKQSPFERGCQAGRQEQPGWRRGGMGVQRGPSFNSREPRSGGALGPCPPPLLGACSRSRLPGDGAGGGRGRWGGDTNPLGGPSPASLPAPPPRLARLVPTISSSGPAGAGAGSGRGRGGGGERVGAGREALAEPRRHRRIRHHRGTVRRPGLLGSGPAPRSPPAPAPRGALPAPPSPPAPAPRPPLPPPAPSRALPPARSQPSAAASRSPERAGPGRRGRAGLREGGRVRGPRGYEVAPAGPEPESPRGGNRARPRAAASGRRGRGVGPSPAMDRTRDAPDSSPQVSTPQGS